MINPFFKLSGKIPPSKDLLNIVRRGFESEVEQFCKSEAGISSGPGPALTFWVLSSHSLDFGTPFHRLQNAINYRLRG